MVTFKCTLTPESVSRLHSALTCLAKFHETIGLEISSSELNLVSINRMQTTCASVTLAADTFFQTYFFSPDTEDPDADTYERFRCSLYNKTLTSVFKGRTGDSKDPESALERCEIVLQDEPERVDCRLVVTMVARSGVRKIYRLNYDTTEVLRAVFNVNAAGNRWTMSAYMLKAFSEYFGPRTELLDFYGEEGRVTITSYTEKVMKGTEVLKQPLQTQIEVDTLDFADYVVEEGMHVGISVKDFRAIVVHAETLKTAITARYGRPGRPMLMAYEELGMKCEYTLSTTGQYRGSTTPAPNASRQQSAVPQKLQTAPQAPASVRPSAAPSGRATSVRVQDSHQPSVMAPPNKPGPRANQTAPGTQQSGLQFASTARSIKPPVLVPSASVDEESLFVADDSNEQQWDEADYDVDDQDQLGWGDSNADTPLRTLTQASVVGQGSVIKESFATEEQETFTYRDDEEVPPTQDMAGMKGLFD